MIIIDVRELGEFDRGHVEGAINISPSELMSGTKKLEDIPKGADIVLYCVSGARSNSASHIMAQMGFTNLTNGINKDQVAAKFGLNIVN